MDWITAVDLGLRIVEQLERHQPGALREAAGQVIREAAADDKDIDRVVKQLDGISFFDRIGLLFDRLFRKED